MNGMSLALIRGLVLLTGGFIAVLGLAGCATMSAEHCRDAKWEELGRADGRRGEQARKLEQHREVCASHGLEPKAEEWRRGYEQGVGEFCTPAGGYNAGRANVGDASLCAGRPGQPEFLAAHQHGGQVFVLLREVREMYRDMRMALAERYSQGEPIDNEAWRLNNSEFTRTLRRRELWLKQRDGEFCDKYGVERLTDADLDPDSAR